MTGEAVGWGFVDPEPELIGPHPDMSTFSPLTWHILGWLSEKRLRPTQGDTWQFPPQMTVHFGVGSGWLWGQLTILRDTGKVAHLKARWVDGNGDHRIATMDGSPR